MRSEMATYWTMEKVDKIIYFFHDWTKKEKYTSVSLQEKKKKKNIIFFGSLRRKKNSTTS